MFNFSLSNYAPSMALVMTLIASFAALGPVPAQPTPALIEDWRASDFNYASSMMDTDQSDHVVVLGDTATSRNLIIKKFDAAGALLWQTPYDAVEALSGVWIAVDGNGNAVVQANTIRISTGQPTGWLTLKYDADGTLLWANSRPGVVSGSVRVEVDANDNIYVAGFALNDSVLIKYSPTGATLWTAVFDNNGAIDAPSSMAISPDGSRIAVAGVSGNLFMALMYDANGNRLWANTNSAVYAAGDAAFGPGNISYFAAGAYFPQDPNPYQMAIVKFDAAGNQLWIKSYSVGDRTMRVALDAQGNIVATGVDSIGYMDWMTIKTDANGNLLWSQRYDGGRNNDETPSMLAVDASGAVYVTGKGGPNPGSGNLSYVKGVAVKYNPDGTPQWAVWDDYAGGKAIRLGAANTLATLGWNYLVTTHYTQTSLPDLLPNPPTNLSGFASNTGSGYEVRLNFSDNANNEFWVEAERCAGSGCTDFTTVAQSRGENVTALTDTTVAQGVAYTYRVRARGFMGLSGPSNTATIIIPGVICPDFNHDGVVDAADLSAIASLWGQPAPAGYDLDGDGSVTIADIQMAAARWGASCP
ncbi:dockerin type I domain-containing protein [Candidatus Amarolinea aalborgensis]|uniref:dockerin type I domain-containing protein n=1 Tax=Candidatus Amarolinea aalborgensis TaxID=2249329 RepID=UPI003BF957D3